MPVISWTAGEILKSKTVEAGIYRAELIKYDGPKPSSSGKGINVYFTFRCTDAKAINKEFDVAGSSAMNSNSILGDRQFVILGPFVAQLDAAVNGKSQIEVADGSGDLDDYLHKPVTLNIGVETVEGKLINVINSIQPEGAATSGPAF